METTRHCCQILIKLECSRQNFENYANIKLQENPSRGSRTGACGQTDMTKQIVALCNFANMPENDVYRWSMYRSSDGEGTSVIWWTRRRLKKGVPRRQYWVHPYFNKSGEFGCCQETRPGHYNVDHFTGWHGKTFKFCTFLNDQDLSNHTKWSVPRQAPQVWCLLPRSSLQKPVMHFESLWEPCLQWRYVHDWVISDITCRVGIVSYRPIVNISLSYRIVFSVPAPVSNNRLHPFVSKPYRHLIAIVPETASSLTAAVQLERI
jgi:hypothetical protein